MKIKVETATILHKYGTSVLTEVGSIKEKVYQWVKDWWHEVDDGPVPEDRDEAIGWYFEHHGSETVTYGESTFEFEHPYEQAFVALTELEAHEETCGLCPGSSCKWGDHLRRVFDGAVSAAMDLYAREHEPEHEPKTETAEPVAGHCADQCGGGCCDLPAAPAAEADRPAVEINISGIDRKALKERITKVLLMPVGGGEWEDADLPTGEQCFEMAENVVKFLEGYGNHRG